jgi:16S rRNA (guanine(966)-N(2))-methyltransferase RsmD
VRETVFNWLGQDLAGWRVLDLFAGTGAMGMEAASRGAAQVTMIEREPLLVRAVRALTERLGAQAVFCVQADVLQWLDRPAPDAAAFDLVLLDPPFGGTELMRALPGAIGRLSPQGLLYLEWGEPLALGAPPLSDCAALSGFEMHRSGRAGRVHYHLLRRAVPGAP